VANKAFSYVAGSSETRANTDGRTLSVGAAVNQPNEIDWHVHDFTSGRRKRRTPICPMRLDGRRKRFPHVAAENGDD